MSSSYLAALAATHIGEELCHHNEHDTLPYSFSADARPYAGFHALLGNYIQIPSFLSRLRLSRASDVGGQAVAYAALFGGYLPLSITTPTAFAFTGTYMRQKTLTRVVIKSLCFIKVREGAAALIFSGM